MNKLLLVLLLSGCASPYQLRVISVSDRPAAHCIEKNRIVCEWSTK